MDIESPKYKKPERSKLVQVIRRLMPDAMREFSSCHFVPMRQYLRTTVEAKRLALDDATLCKVELAQTITRRVVPMQILAVRFGVAVPTMDAS